MTVEMAAELVSTKKNFSNILKRRLWLMKLSLLNKEVSPYRCVICVMIDDFIQSFYRISSYSGC